jgi:(1->4)-alpha-D-glucan 1-alpha-D-glucosylmutase
LNHLKEKSSTHEKTFTRELLENWHDGTIKLFLIWKTLSVRQRFPALFAGGDFQPAEIHGERTGHLTAFLRTLSTESALVIAPKFLAASGIHHDPATSRKFWHDTTICLPAARNKKWVNIFTGQVIDSGSRGQDQPGELHVSDVLQPFPVALLLPARS